MRWSIAAAALFVVTSIVAAEPQVCRDCHLARYWTIPPDAWRDASKDLVIPEKASLDAREKKDLGIAFSGGGTRSAAATLGELRGLQHNGWLDSVRYVTAVSGGSWAAVPFTFYEGELDTLLGHSERPEDLAIATIDTPNGALAHAITHSGLLAAGIWEGVDIAQEQLGSRIPFYDQFSEIYNLLRQQVHGRDAERRDKTYGRVLERIFLKGLVPQTVNHPFAWNLDQVGEISSKPENRDLRTQDFAIAGPRPFLIAGGTLIRRPNAGMYPQLMPVEYTPLYTGIRQQFGDNVGGAYIWSWAYDSAQISRPIENYLAVNTASSSSTFTLADVIASSGAAPQLALILANLTGKAHDVQAEAARFFPAFQHVTIQTRARPEPATTSVLPHGDGGFTDNLGLLPLLARQVHNAIVFVNSDTDPLHNGSLRSYFQQLGQDTSGDKSLNVVFDHAALEPLLLELTQKASDGAPPVACRQLSVGRNEWYNIRGYQGLNVCFVYNQRTSGWTKRLGPGLREELFPTEGTTDHSKRFQHFPHFETFLENKPMVIQLDAVQVNALANFTEWLVSNDASKSLIADTLDSSLQLRR